MMYKHNPKFAHTELTIWWIKMLVNVRNCVTTRAILPGIAERGTMKLIDETTTIEMQGR